MRPASCTQTQAVWCSEVLRLEPFRRVLDLACVACCPCSILTGVPNLDSGCQVVLNTMRSMAQWISCAHGAYGVDMMCVQESRAPDGACLPTDQPYSYDGPTGIGGCEAGFLVHDCSSLWALFSAVPQSRFPWRYVAALLVGLRPILF